MYKFGIGIQIVKHPHFCSVVRAFEQDALSLAKIGDFLEQVFVGGTPALLLGVGHAVFKSQIHILLIALRKGDQVGKGLIDTVGDGIALFLGRMGQKLHIVAKAAAVMLGQVIAQQEKVVKGESGHGIHKRRFRIAGKQIEQICRSAAPVTKDKQGWFGDLYGADALIPEKTLDFCKAGEKAGIAQTFLNASALCRIKVSLVLRQQAAKVIVIAAVHIVSRHITSPRVVRKIGAYALPKTIL